MRSIGWGFRSQLFSLGAAFAVLLAACTMSVTTQNQAGQEAVQAPKEWQPTDPTPPQAFQPSSAVTIPIATDPSLRLGPGDLIDVGVYNVPELTTKTRISNDGNIYLPLIDYVHVADLTPEEAQGVIEKRLADGGFVKGPHVSLFVSEYASQGVSVLGEVQRPGVYPALGQHRLLDLISAAGGFTERAGRTLTVTHRNQPDKPMTIQAPRNVGDSSENNIRVLPGDTLVVHKADVIYVVGDVAKPSGFLMDRGSLTVLQAFALAGGATSTAKLNSAKIIRKGSEGMSETPIKLKKILQAKAPDVPMQADDILFVPTSQKKIFGKRGIEAAIQAATTVGIYSTVR